MSNKGNVLLSLAALVLGGVFTWYSGYSNFTRIIVLLCGLAFVVPAAISLLAIFTSRRHDSSAMMRGVQLVCSAGGMILGLCIIFLPDVFRSLLFYPFGALLVAAGLLQEFKISRHSRTVSHPGWLHIVPVLLLVAGVVVLCVPAVHTTDAECRLLLIVGISSIAFGINGILTSALGRKIDTETTADPTDSADSSTPAEAAETAEAAEDDTI